MSIIINQPDNAYFKGFRDLLQRIKPWVNILAFASDDGNGGSERMDHSTCS